MDLKKVIEGLVNSEDETGCNGGLTVVQKKWVNKLNEWLIEQNMSEKERVKQEELKAKREVVADEKFARATIESLGLPKDSEVIDSDGWEFDGMNRFYRKFWWSVGDKDSSAGTFIVDFERNSVKVVDVHSNT